MPVSVKKLHMASNLQDLNKLAGIDSCMSTRGERKVSALVKSALKLYDSAKEAMTSDEEDEEVTYVYLFRAIELWKVVSDSEDYKNNKEYYNAMYKKKSSECFLYLDSYSKNLQKRYELKCVEENVNELAQYQLNTSITVKSRKGAEDKPKGTIINAANNSVRKSEENADKQDKFDIKMIPQCLEPRDDSDYDGGKKFIECQELKDLVLGHSFEVLILDVRPKTDFELSNIVKAYNINFPESAITAGLSANKLGSTIRNEDQKIKWEMRDQLRQVVLVDWHSETKDVIPNSPLSNLLNILLKWDPDVIYKNTPLILNGGFEKWLDMYPTLTSNPNIQCPPKPVTNPFIHLSEHNIDYPISELEDIIYPKPKTITKPAISDILAPVHTPTVDRSTKPDSLAKTDKIDHGMEITEKTDTEKATSQIETVEEGKSPSDQGHTSTKDSSVEPNLATMPVRPSTPPRPVEKSYPTTPKQTPDKGDGDGGFTLEKLKFNPTSRSGGLKRASSSPNINKMVEDDFDMLSKNVIPSFDRNTKPKPMYNFDSPRGGNMDTIYLAHSKEGRGLTGLKNLGNLCYMNSIMQCISNTVELTQELTRFNANEVVNTRRQIASEVSALLRVLWRGDTKVSTCRSLKARVGTLRQTFSTSEQQDSHEFLTLLMDWLHEDLNEPSSVKSLSGADEATGEKAWGEFKKKNNSLILDLFYGQLKSTVTCTHCQKQSILFEPFSNLSVPLPANQDTPFEKDRRCSLQECLKLYLTGETISGWVCPSCKTPREAIKKLDITRLPPVLIIHLKRFMSDAVGVGWCRKRMNMVDFPINDFNMKPYTHPDSELRSHSYNLYAVSNHYGSMESGHYTAYCKNHLLNKWYKFDDQDVNEISPADVKSSAAYILFYESTHLEKNRHMD